MVEYAILIALLTLVAVGSISSLQGRARNIYEDISAQMQAVGPG